MAINSQVIAALNQESILSKSENFRITTELSGSELHEAARFFDRVP